MDAPSVSGGNGGNRGNRGNSGNDNGSMAMDKQATIVFRANQRPVYSMDGTIAYHDISVPILDRKHCNMLEFRVHSRYGAYANSDLFPGILARIRRDLFGDSGILRVDKIPVGVTVDCSGFLACVTIKV